MLIMYMLVDFVFSAVLLLGSQETLTDGFSLSTIHVSRKDCLGPCNFLWAISEEHPLQHDAEFYR